MAIILSDNDANYESMTKIGRIEVSETKCGEVVILVSGFEFSSPPTCRMHSVRAMSWLRDVLDAQIKQQMATNGGVRSVVG